MFINNIIIKFKNNCNYAPVCDENVNKLVIDFIFIRDFWYLNSN